MSNVYVTNTKCITNLVTKKRYVTNTKCVTILVAQNMIHT